MTGVPGHLEYIQEIPLTESRKNSQSKQQEDKELKKNDDHYF
jgi:hypothetical protein